MSPTHGQLQNILDQVMNLPPDDRRQLLNQLLQRERLSHTHYEKRRIHVEDDEAPELPDQVDGYWVSGMADAPTERPQWPPNGAILLPMGSTPSEEFVALQLVWVRGAWCPMSEAAVHTYTNTADLNAGLNCWFQPVPAKDGAELEVYRVQLDGFLTHEEVAMTYGLLAGARARDDKRTVQLRFRRCQPPGR